MTLSFSPSHFGTWSFSCGNDAEEDDEAAALGEEGGEEEEADDEETLEARVAALEVAAARLAIRDVRAPEIGDGASGS